MNTQLIQTNAIGAISVQILQDQKYQDYEVRAFKGKKWLKAVTWYGKGLEEAEREAEKTLERLGRIF